MAMRREQVAEQLDVEGVVLDNQDLGQLIHPQTSICNDLGHDAPARQMTPDALALSALAATLTDERRAQRFLDLTGIDPDELAPPRGRAGPAGRLIRFLEAHEPDLIDVAEAIGVDARRAGRRARGA